MCVESPSPSAEGRERLPSILVLSPQPVRGSSGGGGGGRIPGSILVSVLRLLKRTRGGREEACSPPPSPSFPPLCRRWFFFCPSPLRSTSSFWSSSASEGAGRFTVPLRPSFHLPPAAAADLFAKVSVCCTCAPTSKSVQSGVSRCTARRRET